MGTFLIILQIGAALLFVVLMAVQTDRAEQGGVMGLGAQGGRMSGSIDMPVGAERILKPLSKWTAVGFLFLSALASINSNTGGVSPLVVAATIVVYLGVMLFGNRVWEKFQGLFGPQA